MGPGRRSALIWVLGSANEASSCAAGRLRSPDHLRSPAGSPAFRICWPSVPLVSTVSLCLRGAAAAQPGGSGGSAACLLHFARWRRAARGPRAPRGFQDALACCGTGRRALGCCPRMARSLRAHRRPRGGGDVGFHCPLSPAFQRAQPCPVTSLCSQ